MKKVWLVEFPTYQYEENVKQLAAAKNLKVIDARFAKSVNEEVVEKSPPKLTKKKTK